MTQALTKVVAWGIETEEPVNRRYLQYLRLVTTGANTDITYDFGSNVAGSLGTFWTAVSGTQPGSTALTALQDIVKRAQAFLWIAGTGLSVRTAEDASRTTTVVINSAASSGGNATETYTVTGLLTTDTITAVTQYVDGAGAAVGILSYGNSSGNAAADNALAVVYNADPGASAKVKVTVLRVSATPEAGTYIQTLGTVAPNILFASGDAPTAMDITLCWMLKDAEEPVAVTATASAQTPY